MRSSKSTLSLPLVTRASKFSTVIWFDFWCQKLDRMTTENFKTGWNALEAVWRTREREEMIHLVALQTLRPIQKCKIDIMKMLYCSILKVLFRSWSVQRYPTASTLTEVPWAGLGWHAGESSTSDSSSCYSCIRRSRIQHSDAKWLGVWRQKPMRTSKRSWSSSSYSKMGGAVQ